MLNSIRIKLALAFSRRADRRVRWASGRRLAFAFATALAATTVLAGGAALADGGGGGGTPATKGDPAATIGSTISLPYVANAFTDPRNPKSSVDVYNSKITVTDTGSTVACVTVTYSFIGGGRAPVSDEGPGAGLCSRGYPVGPGSQLLFTPTATQGAVAMPAETANALMTATLHATGAPVTVDVDAYVTNSAVKTHAGYRGLVAASTGASAIQVGTKVNLDTVQKTSDGNFSQLFIANAGSTATQASIKFTGADGTPYSMTLPVPAGGGARYGVYDDAMLPVGFKGSAVITSDQPIATVVFQAKMTAPATFAYDDVYTAAPGVAEQLAPIASAPAQSNASHALGVLGASTTVVIYAAALLVVIALAVAFFAWRSRRRPRDPQPAAAHDATDISTMAPRKVPPKPVAAPVASMPAPLRPGNGHPWGRLIVVEGHEAGQSFVLTEDIELVGRGRFCSVRLKDKQVANAHFLVNRDGFLQPSTPACAIEVNGSSERPRSLSNGSLIRVGKTCLRFEMT